MRGITQDAINLIASTDPLTGGLLNTSYDEALQELYSMDYLNTYRIAGGMINLPFAFYNSLISHNPREYDIAPDLLGKVNINFGHNITGIYQGSSGSKVILRYNNTYMTNRYEEFDYVICAIVDGEYLPASYLGMSDTTYIALRGKILKQRLIWTIRAFSALLIYRYYIAPSLNIWINLMHTDRERWLP